MVAALDNPGPVRRPVVPVPASTETVRVVRVATPSRVEMTVDPFESLLTELANDRAVFAPTPRRRFVYVGGALLGVAFLAVIGTAMRVRANDASRFAESPTLPVSASGDLVKSTTTVAPAGAPAVAPIADTTKQPVGDTARSVPVAMPPRGVAASKLEVRLAAEPVKSS